MSFKIDSRFVLYDIILITQANNMGMKVLVDQEEKANKSRKNLMEQYDEYMKGESKMPLHFREATGGEGRIHPNAIAFIGCAPVSDEAASAILSSTAKQDAKEPKA